MGARRGAPLPVAPRRAAAAAGEPFRCGRRRCPVNYSFVSRSWINDHLAAHEYADRKEKEARAKKKAAQEKLIKAAGPSPKKNIQRRLNRAALQRKAAKGDGNTACVGKKRQRGRNQN